MVMLAIMLTATLWYGGKDSTKIKPGQEEVKKQEQEQKKKKKKKKKDCVRYKPRIYD